MNTDFAQDDDVWVGVSESGYALRVAKKADSSAALRNDKGKRFRRASQQVTPRK